MADEVRVRGVVPVSITGAVPVSSMPPITGTVAIDGDVSVAGQVSIDQSEKGPMTVSGTVEVGNVDPIGVVIENPYPVPVTGDFTVSGSIVLDDDPPPAVKPTDPHSGSPARVTEHGEAHTAQRILLLSDTFAGTTLDSGVSLADGPRWITQGSGVLAVANGVVSLTTNSESPNTQLAMDSQAKFQPLPGTMIVLDAILQMPGTPVANNNRAIGFRDDSEVIQAALWLYGTTIKIVLTNGDDDDIVITPTLPTGVGTTNYWSLRIEWSHERVRFLARGQDEPFTLLASVENFYGRTSPYLFTKALRCFLRSWDHSSEQSGLALKVGALSVALVGDIGQAAYRTIPTTGAGDAVLVRGPGFLHGVRVYYDQNDAWTIRDTLNAADNTSGRLLVRKVAHLAAPAASTVEEFIPVEAYFAEGLTIFSGGDDGLLLWVRG